MSSKTILDEMDTRDEIIRMVKAEMLGPGSEDIGPDIENEIITDSPLERYSLGILFPQNNKYKQDDEEDVNITDESTDLNYAEEENNNNTAALLQEKVYSETKHSKSLENDEMQEQIGMANQALPSAMGFTVFTKGATNKIIIKITCARYRKTFFNDCKIRWDINESIRSTALNEYFYIDKCFLKLKQNISRNEVYNLLDRYPELKENKELVNRMYKLADQCGDERTKKFSFIRIPMEFTVTIDLKEDYFKKYLDDLEELSLSVLKRTYANDLNSITIVLVNNNEGEKKYSNTFFQPQMVIESSMNQSLNFVDNAELVRINIDELTKEEQSLEILYLNKKNYAVGHGVATGQEVNTNGDIRVWTDFFPQFEVPQLNFDIAEIKDFSSSLLSMNYMSDKSKLLKEEKILLLRKFVKAYELWIDKLENVLLNLDRRFHKTAGDHISKCRIASTKMNEGITVLEENVNVYTAFELMNRAMTMQRAHSMVKERFTGDENKDFLNISYDKINASWRPFQLAFILLNIESLTNSESVHRNEVELLWVPTGGGKTEAYLGISAFIIFFRRIAYPKTYGGTTILMRYTLRLLAAQQFIRASILICACETIRREIPKLLGKDEINIGLWVGGTPTPNTNTEAKDEFKKLIKKAHSEYELKENKLKHNKFQVLKCPWCGTKLEPEWIDGKVVGEWGYDFDKVKKIFCPEEECEFEYKLPIQVVDEEIYKNPPTLLFGTVDKFAMIAWKEEASRIFALDSKNQNRQPELIIQDELHLISGPLGSIVGMYETAIDFMCSTKGVKPKIIASTATIRRADEQCKMLFNRKVNQFPPAGLCIEDSFFTREKSLDEGFGRKYVGLMASGKTTVTAQVRLLSILLQSIKLIDKEDSIIDKYWTLVSYFNSIRELGKCTTLVEDDVANNIQRLSKRILKGNKTRFVGSPRELTSRLESTEIIKTLKDLENEYSSDDIFNAVSILLATNMISVGVDVSRLNVMLVAGQPKLTSEYIQATSRVGRSHPGVVFTLYNAPKARDRSHYELFYSYHQSFYKYVEPTSVTPFSEQVRERALHAVFISLVRHVLQLNSEEMAGYFENVVPNLKEILDYIIERAEDTDYTVSKLQGKETKDDLNRIIKFWIDKIKGLSGDELLTYKKKNNEKFLMVDYSNADGENALPTMQSMRSVDYQAGVELVVFGDEMNNDN